uniref:SEFIR domain-containing protein n=1 Tax=Echeneis naucrates TaxID=173247 RepID=A0A665SWH0_ECHNA
MGPTLLRGPTGLLLLLFPLRLRLLVAALDMIDRSAPELTFYPYSALLPEPNDVVNVTQMQLKVMLCCSPTQGCVPCLQIIITVQGDFIINLASLVNTVIILLGIKSQAQKSKILSQSFVFLSLIALCVCLFLCFSLDVSPQPTHGRMWLLLTETVTFGSPVVVQVYANSNGTSKVQNVMIPSLEEGEVERCDLSTTTLKCPRLRAKADLQRNVVNLRLDNTNATKDDIMCQIMRDDMLVEIVSWPKGQSEVNISVVIVPCLCFQVLGFKGKPLRRHCPFKNQQGVLERMQHSVSVYMEMRYGGTGWRVTAPCQLEAEVQLCKKNLEGGNCEEVLGSRQTLHRHADWSVTHDRYWRTGEFNVSSHPLHCVQVIKHLYPHELRNITVWRFIFPASRWRWSLPLLVGFLLICLAVLGAYFIQGVLRGYVWRWLKDDDVKGAVGGSHVVLLYPPDDNQALPELICLLGSSLQALGFSVSLDLWSQAELSVLGPVPWLHSRLDRLKRQGGKVVLILTQATWKRAEEWGAQLWERNRDRVEEDSGRNYPASSASVDVFSASLSCILADYFQGRAGERFMLAQFGSLPPRPPGGFRPLPELFRGLHVYSLPSQSLGFLTELAGPQKIASAATRRKRTGGLRVASRALAKRLSGFTGGTTVLHLAGVSQSCVGVGKEDSGEMVPLQPCQMTPPQ